ncbi:MAG: amino acid ABC transporter permease [Clostridia bacterium]|nr:amino acid ABC transporter permease [Clostridia bacterium]NCD03751.1 amino acid ABC transporter permease [Clostridia bacterium]
MEPNTFFSEEERGPRSTTKLEIFFSQSNGDRYLLRVDFPHDDVNFIHFNLYEPFRLYLEFIRFMPQLVLLFIVYFGSTRALGWDLSGEAASVIVFVLWGTAEMGDLVRSAFISIPKHQYESSEVLGLTKGQTYQYIIIPQTLRRLLPLSINLITRMIKTTSLVLMIGVVEMLKVAQQIIEANRMASPNAAFGVFLVVFILYFFACWPISLLARYLEKKWR